MIFFFKVKDDTDVIYLADFGKISKKKKILLSTVSEKKGVSDLMVHYKLVIKVSVFMIGKLKIWS